VHFSFPLFLSRQLVGFLVVRALRKGGESALEVDVLEVEVLVVVLLLFAEDLGMEGLIAQEAQFEDELYALLNVYCVALGDLLALVGFGQLFEGLVVEEQEDKYLVEGLDVVKVVGLLIEGDLHVAQGHAQLPHHFLQELEVLLGDLALEEADEHIENDLEFGVLQLVDPAHLVEFLEHAPELFLLVPDLGDGPSLLGPVLPLLVLELLRLEVGLGDML
jgi:hypothetical protein